MELIEKITKIVNENWRHLSPYQREPYEDNYDGFPHYTKDGLIEQIAEELDNENMKPTKDNIEQLFFDLV